MKYLHLISTETNETLDKRRIEGLDPMEKHHLEQDMLKVVGEDMDVRFEEREW